MVRAANGVENSRSTLTTGMPASIALVATSVNAAPSVGSRTMASTLSLMKVSTWLICWLASLVPSALFSVTSEYFFASARAELLIAASQPWSAAGPENPMTIFLPGSSLFDVAVVVPLLSPLLLSVSFVSVLQAVRNSIPARAAPVTSVNGRRWVWRDIGAPSGGPRTG